MQLLDEMSQTYHHVAACKSSQLGEEWTASESHTGSYAVWYVDPTEWIELDRARKALALVERAASDLKWHQAEPAPVSYEAWVRQIAECIYNIVRDARRTP